MLGDRVRQLTLVGQQLFGAHPVGDIAYVDHKLVAGPNREAPEGQLSRKFVPIRSNRSRLDPLPFPAATLAAHHRLEAPAVRATETGWNQHFRHLASDHVGAVEPEDVFGRSVKIYDATRLV